MKRWLPPLLVLLAAASGAAALIYEIAWFQFLELYLGSSAVALATLLATFMAGTCLGSLLFARINVVRRHPLVVYGAIEIGIGGCGILAVAAIPFAGNVYTAGAGYGVQGFLLRGLVAAACLLPPTLLIGATFPALARVIAAAPGQVSWLGAFYAGNIAGAVAGCVLAGFYLLRLSDVVTTVVFAAAINAAIAATAFSAAERGSSDGDRLKAELQTEGPSPSRRGWPEGPGEGIAHQPVSQEPEYSSAPIYIAIALSGFCALAAETIWTRRLGLLFGASVYTFSIVLAAFLAGLGAGSGFGSILTRAIQRPRRTLGWCPLLTGGAILWTAWTLSASLPYWPVNPSMASDVWSNFRLDFARALWALLPPTFLWGASFPLALAAIASARRQDPAKLVAGVYAANTLGAIAGALTASLVLIVLAGSDGVEKLLIALGAATGLLLLLPGSRRTPTRTAALAVGAALVTGLLLFMVPPIPKLLIAHGRYASTWAGAGNIIFAQEGLNSSVAVSTFPNGTRTFHVAGKIQASSAARDMRLQRMLGHLTTLIPPRPRSVLVIGCGAGVTAGAVSIDPRVDRVTVVDIEPLVPQTADLYFREQNFDVIRNPKVQVRIDDGRHFVLTSRERFDAITADPLDPWVKGAANLYTKEFLEAARAHLNPGGVVTLYIQLFETDVDAVKSALATFFQVFPNGSVWGNTYAGKGHDMVLLGEVEPLRIDLDAFDERLNRAEHFRIAQSLREVGLGSAVDLFATYAGQGRDLAPWLKGAAINRDRNLRLQYLAGLGLDRDDSPAIYADMLRYRRFPENVFSGTASRLAALREAIEP